MKYTTVQGDRCIQCILYLASSEFILRYQKVYNHYLPLQLPEAHLIILNAHGSIYISDKVTRTYLQYCKSP